MSKEVSFVSMDIQTKYKMVVEYLTTRHIDGAKKLTLKAIAKELAISYTHFTEMVAGKKPVTEMQFRYIKSVYSVELGSGKQAILNTKYNLLLNEYISLNESKSDDIHTKNDIDSKLESKALEFLKLKESWQG